MSDQNPSQPQRRRFTRIQFPADVTVTTNGATVAGRLVDISLHGALVLLDEAGSCELDSTCILNLALTEQVAITMKLKVAHVNEQMIGCECREIDLDSLTHLKRLVAYNIGDQDLLERQLGELITSDSD